MPYLQPPELPRWCLRSAWACRSSYSSFPGTSGAVRQWLRHRNLTRCLCPDCHWASLEATLVHAVYTPEKLEETLGLKGLYETLQWCIETIAGLHLASRLKITTRLCCKMCCLHKQETMEHDVWQWLHGSTALPVKWAAISHFSEKFHFKCQCLSAAALAKQTSAASCSSLVISQVLSTVPELPVVLFHCVVLHLARH